MMSGAACCGAAYLFSSTRSHGDFSHAAHASLTEQALLKQCNGNVNGNVDDSEQDHNDSLFDACTRLSHLTVWSY